VNRSQNRNGYKTVDDRTVEENAKETPEKERGGGDVTPPLDRRLLSGERGGETSEKIDQHLEEGRGNKERKSGNRKDKIL